MKKLFKGRLKKIGLPPGSLVYLGEEKNQPVLISIFDYSPAEIVEKETYDSKDCLFVKEKDSVSWINLDGIHNVELIDSICRFFNIHSLTIEDILNTEQRPKIELKKEYLYLVFNMLTYHEIQHRISSEQVSLILLNNHVFSFQETQGDTFEPVRDRIRNAGRIRNLGGDYLFYALIDTVVDHYFYILEKIGDRIEFLEETLMENPTTEILVDLYNLKKQVLTIRKSVWPMREIVMRLERGDFSQIGDETKIFFRDVYDHTIQVIDTVESYRDILSSLADLYQSVSGNKLNEAIKVLTVISTTFIPLTFITGLYGMNFKYMPELEWKYSYAVVWAIIIFTVSLMLYLFRRRRWL
jgi:magnesium transporter